MAWSAPFRTSENVVVLADTHFYHDRIMLYCDRTKFMTEGDLLEYQRYKESEGKYRPHLSRDSVESMNQSIIDSINRKILDPQRDIVIFVGDFVFGNRHFNSFERCNYRQHAQSIVERINCRDLRLIIGNHDTPDLLGHYFREIYDQLYINVNGQKLFLSHFPHIVWEGRHCLHLYGHVHGIYSKSHPLVAPDQWKAIDVGVDANHYEAWTVPEIQKAIFFEK